MSLVQEESAAGGRAPTPVVVPRRPAARRALREVLLVAVLFVAYKIGRLAADGHAGVAMDNAENVWRLERLLHLPSEYWLQQAFLDSEWLVRAANCYYAYVHFPATAACLIWLYGWRRSSYVPVRRLLAWLTAASLVVHLLMPLAPPRMLAAVGMVDTGHRYGPAVYGAPATDTLTNQYAAMPSLHVGWALAIAIALMGVTRGPWRRLWLLHPAITVLVVVVTGNHYWLDAIVVAALLAAVAWALSIGATRPRAVVPRPRAG
jgi:hypothetical protein